MSLAITNKRQIQQTQSLAYERLHFAPEERKKVGYFQSESTVSRRPLKFDYWMEMRIAWDQQARQQFIYGQGQRNASLSLYRYRMTAK